MVKLPEIPVKKTTAFLFLGILLYLGSAYLNILQGGSASLGIPISEAVMAIAILAQVINWLGFWHKKGYI